MENNWFVFSVVTGRENKVSEFLIREGLNSFIPKVENFFISKEYGRKQIRPMFPGYVLVETDIDCIEFITTANEITYRNKYIKTILEKKNPYSMALTQAEKDFLLTFCDDEYLVGESIGYIEGDRAVVTEGPLKGHDGKITYVNRHKRIARIEVPFLGQMREVQLALTILTKL